LVCFVSFLGQSRGTGYDIVPSHRHKPAGMALPSLPKPPAREMAGPTPFSNWVIPGVRFSTFTHAMSESDMLMLVAAIICKVIVA